MRGVDYGGSVTLYYDNKHTTDSYKVSNENTQAIVSGIDYEHEEILMTFISDRFTSFTLSFSKDLSAFTSKFDFTPTVYFNLNRFLFSTSASLSNLTTNKSNEIYLHNHGKYGQFYGIYYKSYVIFVVNASPNVAKIFHNGFINVNEEYSVPQF